MTQKKKTKNKTLAVENREYSWSVHAWEDYVYWQERDPEIAQEINSLLKEIRKTPFTGTGKPEPLKGDLTGFWSRRITKVDRLVYIVQDGVVFIMQCRQHY
ncbi:Txe/YoeB family addiction module toxin [Ralstonia pseudosolanacearum]|uniref:Txe/YoeB family addiction module toxin n=1 Tax=Ralstonia pseudosolanacearum TaxID=1310165 RepID=UPI003AAC2039